MTQNATTQFTEECQGSIIKMGQDTSLKEITEDWFLATCKHKYSYNFTWMGRPIIQYPQDMIAMQEVIWNVKPDLIIETGIAHGGSLIYYASLLEMIGGNGRIVGIDIDIREHNRTEIEQHPMFKRIDLIEGSATDPQIADRIYKLAAERKKVLVVLDSNHTHDHVLAELNLYAKLVSKDSYLVVFDTVVEDMPPAFFPDRPWGKGDNPKTAVWEFLKTSDRFVVDEQLESKLLITVAPNGYLKCIKD
jgi:cephalosporin hydroxylase